MKEKFTQKVNVKIGNLELCNKTFLSGEHRGLEICQWDKDKECKWTIASFDFYEKEDCYELKSCCDRLNDKDIDWVVFGQLVMIGYSLLKIEIQGVENEN